MNEPVLDEEVDERLVWVDLNRTHICDHYASERAEEHGIATHEREEAFRTVQADSA